MKFLCIIFGHKWGKTTGPHLSSMCSYKHRQCLRCKKHDKMIVEIFKQY